MNKTLSRLVATSRFLIALFTIALASMNLSADAQVLGIGENAEVLRAQLDFDQGLITQAALDMAIMKQACNNPASRLMDRNRPYLSIFNNSATEGEITSVLINMEEAGFEFGDGDMAGDGFDGLLSMLSTESDDGVELTGAVLGNDSSELLVSFSGLSQGQAAIFRVDIDEPGAALLYPDYRDAMLGANEGNGRNGDLALFTIDFASGQSTNLVFEQMGLVPNAGLLEGYHTQTMPTPQTTEIPEPTTMCLLFAGLSGIAAMRRTRSKNAS